MIKRNIYNTSFVIVSVFFSLFATAQNKTIVKATVDRSKILIGEPIRLVLEADIPENRPIRFFRIDSLPHFEFLIKEKIDTLNTSNGTVLSQLIHITSFDSGHWVIPAFDLGDKIATDTIPVDVGFSSFDPQQPYHDIKDIIEVSPEQEKKKQYWWWYLAAGILLLFIILVLVLRKKKQPLLKAIEEQADPYKTAMDNLERLQKDKNDPKQYYSKLVDILRMYVLARKGLHSLQKTTDDLVIQLRSLELSKEQFEQLSQSLRLSDFVKFAKYIPAAADDKRSFEIIKSSIEYIEKTARDAAPTGIAGLPK